MSTINVSNITDGTDTVGTSYVVNGSAKAWINFNAIGTTAILESFSVSSLIDNSAGNFDFGLSSAMSNANYAGVCGQFESNDNSSIVVVALHTTNCTASNVRVLVNTSTAGAFDAPFNSVSLLGDLA